MLTRRTAILACLLFVPVCAATVALADYKDHLVTPGKLTIATAPGNPGMIVDSSGNYTGYDIDYIVAIAERLGLEPEIVVIDFAGLLPGIIAGRFDVGAASITRSKARVESPDFLFSEGYALSGIGALTRKDSGIDTWEDICGRKAGINRGSSEIKLVADTLPENCITDISEYPSWSENLLDLKNGRTDFILSSFNSSSYYARTNEDLKLIPGVRKPFRQGVVVSKDNPELLDEINKITEELITSGEMDAIFAKYGIEPDWDTFRKVEPVQ